MKRCTDFKFFSMVAKVTIGLWLMLPFFDTFKSADTFKYMMFFIPNTMYISSENIWGLLFFSIGIIGTIAYTRKKHTLYMVIRYMSNAVWIFWAVCLWMGFIGGTGAPFYTVVAMFDMINTVEIHNRRIE